MSKKRTTRRRPPKVNFRYVATKSSRFSDDDAIVIGSCLQRIAEKNTVDGIRSLDKNLVLEEYEAGRAPELDQYLEQDKDKAQRKHWKVQIGVMIRSIQITQVNVDLGPRPDPRPQFVTTKHRRGHGIAPVRSRVLTDDVMASNPLFAGAFGLQVRNINNAVKKLEHLVDMKQNAPDHMLELPAALRAVMDDYLAEVIGDAAE